MKIELETQRQRQLLLRKSSRPSDEFAGGRLTIRVWLASMPFLLARGITHVGARRAIDDQRVAPRLTIFFLAVGENVM